MANILCTSTHFHCSHEPAIHACYTFKPICNKSDFGDRAERNATSQPTFYPLKRGDPNSRCSVAGPTKLCKLVLIFVGLQFENCLMSHLWHLELYWCSFIFGKFVYPWSIRLISPSGISTTPVRPTLQYQLLGRFT